jgi:Tfp pilus assembly protein PilF
MPYLLNSQIKEDRMESINSLLLAEFYTATGYLDRLLFAFTEMEKIHLTPRGKMQIQKLCLDSASFFGKYFKEMNFISDNYVFETSNFKNHIKYFHNFIESAIKLPISSEKMEKTVIEYINLIYRNSYEIHHFINGNTSLEIQLPRTGLTEIENIPTIKNTTNQGKELSGDSKSVPLFYLDEKSVRELSHVESVIKSPIAFLDIKREEKYDYYIHRGHSYIAQKKYLEAKEHFYKARNYKDSAEVLTLIAWTYSLLGNISEAKTYCTKAINKDSQYGPAYNDFGNYILNEGQVKESLRWFELAKRAHNYQNREYPYINAGRAYVLLKQYEAGLNEFSLALTLAPHHQELHETVAKLRNNLDRENQPPHQM